MRKDIVGVCKDFFQEEGWGWISIEGEQDVWVHYTAIQSYGFRTLNPGEQVVFDLEENPKLNEQSRRATNVQLIKTQ